MNNIPEAMDLGTLQLYYLMKKDFSQSLKTFIQHSRLSTDPSQTEAALPYALR